MVGGHHLVTQMGVLRDAFAEPRSRHWHFLSGSELSVVTVGSGSLVTRFRTQFRLQRANLRAGHGQRNHMGSMLFQKPKEATEKQLWVSYEARARFQEAEMEAIADRGESWSTSRQITGGKEITGHCEEVRAGFSLSL